VMPEVVEFDSMHRTHHHETHDPENSVGPSGQAQRVMESVVDDAQSDEEKQKRKNQRERIPAQAGGGERQGQPEHGPQEFNGDLAASVRGSAVSRGAAVIWRSRIGDFELDR